MFFFFNDTATTEIYTLSLHDALPIFRKPARQVARGRIVLAAEAAHLRPELVAALPAQAFGKHPDVRSVADRSEEHTSELQSRQYLVCRLLLEKKKTQSLVESVKIADT